MDIIKAFQKNEVGINITIKGTHESPLFRASDIGEVLDIGNIRPSIQDFDNTEKHAVSTTDVIGREQEVSYLTEKGLYKVLFRSRKPIAKQFTDWVCEVLKEIRLKGVYDLQQQLKLKEKDSKEILIDNFKNKQVIYFILVEENVLKFGFSGDIKTRFADHLVEFGPDIKLSYVFETRYNREFEQMIKTELKKYIISKKYKNNQTELIELSDNFTYDQLKRKIEKLKEVVNENLVPKLLNDISEMEIKIAELEREINNNSHYHKLKEENEQLRLKVIELETKLANNNKDVEMEKLRLRKQELDMRYTQNLKSKNSFNMHRLENGIEQKFCPGILCREETESDGKWLTLDHFGKSDQNKDGLRGECKKCRNVSERTNYERKDHKMTAEQLEESKHDRSMKLRVKLIDGKKECTKCEVMKDIDEYEKIGAYITGEDKYRSDCRECRKKQKRKPIKAL